jgi:hypothetical protein
VKRKILKLSDFHSPQHTPSISDAAIDHFIMKAGAERVLAALDRLTMPVPSFEEAAE